MTMTFLFFVIYLFIYFWLCFLRNSGQWLDCYDILFLNYSHILCFWINIHKLIKKITKKTSWIIKTKNSTNNNNNNNPQTKRDRFVIVNNQKPIFISQLLNPTVRLFPLSLSLSLKCCLDQICNLSKKKI